MSRRIPCDTCGKLVQSKQPSRSFTRCHPCRRANPQPKHKYVKRGRQAGHRAPYLSTSCKQCSALINYSPGLSRKPVYCSKPCQIVGQTVTGGKWARNNGLGKTSSKVYFRNCAECSRLYTTRYKQMICCSKYCSARRDLGKSRKRITDLYSMACEIGITGTAWRRTLYAVLRERDGDLCACCFTSIDFTLRSGTRGSDAGPSVEHLTPRSKGGTDDMTNLALSHWGCNRNRRTRALEDVWADMENA